MQDSGHVGITGKRWDVLHDWSVVMEGHRLSGKDRPGKQEIGVQGEKKKAELGGCEMVIMDGQESTLQGRGKSRSR